MLKHITSKDIVRSNRLMTKKDRALRYPKVYNSKMKGFDTHVSEIFNIDR